MHRQEQVPKGVVEKQTDSKSLETQNWLLG